MARQVREITTFVPPITGEASGLTLSWPSVSGKKYYLQRSANLAAQPAFLSIQSYVVGQTGTTSWNDTGATGPGPYFYRLGVQWGPSGRSPLVDRSFRTSTKSEINTNECAALGSEGMERF